MQSGLESLSARMISTVLKCSDKFRAGVPVAGHVNEAFSQVKEGKSTAKELNRNVSVETVVKMTVEEEFDSYRLKVSLLLSLFKYTFCRQPPNNLPVVWGSCCGVVFHCKHAQ